MDGVLVIDKPTGPTSHDIVARARRALGEPRVGHTGTLDPAASGVLALVLGRATRLARFLTAGDKSYEAVIHLGTSTDTADAQGAPVGTRYDGPWPTRLEIEAGLGPFRGRFLQQPPLYSAKKIDGTRSYRLARAEARRRTHASPDVSARAPGVESVALDTATEPPLRRPVPVEVTAHGLEILSLEAERLVLRVECSAGFYVRSLAHDLGERLGTGAHLSGLRRTRSGDYGLTEAIPIDVVERDLAAAVASVVPLASMLPRLSAVVLTPDGITRARHGRELGPAEFAFPLRGASHELESPAPSESDDWVRLLASEGQLVGLGRRVSSSGLLHPSVVLI
ncbi:MAG: tRNA pseudouridine(55) synthase TruB [Acidobacteriota bacterium]